MKHGRRVAVVGVGQTKHGFFRDRTWKEMVVESCYEALKDARMDPGEIQTGFFSITMPEILEQENLGAAVADQLGICPAGFTQLSAACAGGGAGIRLGVLSIASGVYDKVLVTGIEKISDSIQATEPMANVSDPDYEYTWGFNFSAMAALSQMRYMHTFGAKQECFEMWPIIMRWYGRRNPKALDYNRPEMTLEDVRSSPWISWPVRYATCAKACDGSSAVVLTTEEIARKYSDTPIYVDGIGLATGPVYQTARFNYPEWDEFDICANHTTVMAADEAYKMADCRPEDIDFAQIHDCFAPNAIIQLEALQLFPVGKAAEAVLHGEVAIDGRIPVNTDGGRFSLGHPTGTTGINIIVEATNQMRGKCADRQVKKPDVAMCQAMGGQNATEFCAILRRT